MKKIFVVLFAVLLVLGITAASYAAISSTKHNLTTGNITGSVHTTDASATLCGFCHIPHGGNASTPQLPLWARATATAGSYTVYSSGGAGFTLNGTAVNQPGTFSLTCLSCHDGTIGVGTIVKNGVSQTYTMTGTYVNPATGQLIVVAGQAYQPDLTQVLTNDHPVGLAFPAGATGYGATGGIPGIGVTVINPGTSTAHLNSAVSAGNQYPLYQETGIANAFECASCHEPHRSDTAGQTKFLRGPNATLCQDCHNLK